MKRTYNSNLGSIFLETKTCLVKFHARGRNPSIILDTKSIACVRKKKKKKKPVSEHLI